MSVTESKIKNVLFRVAIRLMGNKGLSRNFIGKAIKEYAVKNCRTNEITVNDYRMILDKDDSLRLSLFPYEPIETQLVKQYVKAKDCVVDVGANIGYYTLLMAKQRAIVHSFEPEPKNFALLKKNVELNNFTNVILYNKELYQIQME